MVVYSHLFTAFGKCEILGSTDNCFQIRGVLLGLFFRFLILHFIWQAKLIQNRSFVMVFCYVRTKTHKLLQWNLPSVITIGTEISWLFYALCCLTKYNIISHEYSLQCSMNINSVKKVESTILMIAVSARFPAWII